MCETVAGTSETEVAKNKNKNMNYVEIEDDDRLLTRRRSGKRRKPNILTTFQSDPPSHHSKLLQIGLIGAQSAPGAFYVHPVIVTKCDSGNHLTQAAR